MKSTPVVKRGLPALIAILSVIALTLGGVLASGVTAANADDGLLTFTTIPGQYGIDQPFVGEDLDASSTYGWDPIPDTLDYQWYRNGVALPGETTAQYLFTPDDLGAVFTLAVTGHKTGYEDKTVTSDPSDPVSAGFISGGTPTISGTPEVGSTLTADPDAGDWSPEPASYTYQWFNDNAEIENATSSTYTLTKRDAGQQIHVEVRGHLDGYSDGFGQSDQLRIDGVGYSVTGILTGVPDGGGAPVPLDNVFVELYQGSDSFRTSYAFTDNTGKYEIDFGPDDPTADYTLQFNRSASPGSTGYHYVSVWLGNVIDQSHATQFQLSPSAPAVTEDLQLDRGATVSGVVKDSSGNPIPDAFVNLTPPGQVNGAFGQTDANGEYTLHQVSSTETIMSVQAQDWSDTSALDTKYYNTQWWDHASSADTATPLDIVPGATIQDINFDLTDEATITGRVVDAQGDGVPDMSYTPWHYNADSHLYVSPRSGPFLTDADGYFRQPANGWTSYKFSFDDELGAGSDAYPIDRTPYDTAWYDNATGLSTATAVDVTGPSSQTDIGNIVVTPHSGGPAFVGAPSIDDSDFVSDNYLELTGVAATPGTATVSVQWNRDGVPIDGGDTFDYQPTPDDQGHQLTATLTASLDGFPDASVTTAPYDLRHDFVGVTTPVITGTAAVGQPLSVSDGTWTPTPDTVSYQWFRTSGVGDPVAIDGATDSTYTPTAADFGDTISASVTATAVGYRDATGTASATAAVTAGTLSTATPTITGTAAVGSTLTAVPGTWGPGTVDFAYQWISGTTDIPDATSSTYTPVTADAGAKLSVRVTGSETGYASASQTSSQTATIGDGTLTTATPTIVGTPTVGQTLTALAGSWGPGAVTLTYQWLRGSTDILGANASTYALASADAGATISVRVTGTESGYATASATSTATAVVAAGALTTGTPTIAGSAAVGSTLTASPGTWGPGSVTFAYQWVRGSTDIGGATSSTYALVGADAGAKISVRVTGSEAGYATASATSAQTATIAAGTLSEGTPTITGTPAVGSTLTAHAGTWGPGTVGFSYQWVRGGADIVGATSSTYTPVSADAGATISVRVTGSETGYATASVTSAPTAAVTGGTLTAGTVTVTGTTTFTSTLTANAGTWGPGTVTLSYQWLRGGADIAGATDATYTLQAADVGAKISVRVTGTETDFATLSATSAETAVVAALDFTSAPTASITGPSALNVLTAALSTDNWTPTQDTVSYQWYRNGQPISGATAKTHTIVVADVAQSITVAVTATKAGYRPASSLSTAFIPANAIFTAGTPTISGTTTVGQTLTIDPGVWTPTPDAFEYRWQYGTCATGATAIQDGALPTYVIQPPDVGKTICATVTGRAANFQDKTATTASTAVVTRAPLTTGTPTVTGVAAIGQTLTADAGDWGPGTVVFAYQWYRDDVAIPGATTSTYAVAGTDVGHQLHVTVTGSENGYQTSGPISSDPTDAVTPAIFAGSEAIAVTGVSAVGRTLTATITGALTPSPTSSSISWLRDGSVISGATKSTYVLTAADMGHAVAAAVTAKLSGYVDFAATSNAITATGVFTTVPTPTISGTAKLGATLTAVPGNWSPVTTPATTFDYQWRVNGTVVQDGAAQTYVATTDDVGFPITVTVTGSATGYAPASATSVPTAKIAAGALVAATPKITGTVKVNDTLAVVEGAWSPAPDSYTYQWYRAGTAISGATGSTYLLTGTDYTKTITVTVTAHLRGYANLAKASAATVKVAAGTITAPASGTMTLSTARVGTAISVTTGATWGPTPVTFAYQWYYKKPAATTWTALSKATAATYTPASNIAGDDILVQVRASKTGYTTTAYVQSQSEVIGTGSMTTAVPSITGTAAIGSTLTATHTGWAPAGATFHYQWYRLTEADPTTPVAITGATAETYKVTSGDVDATFQVAVSATAAGYTPSDVVPGGSTAKVMAPFTVTKTGTAKTGDTLTAAASDFPEGATLTYQWYYVSGSTSKAISGATKSTYKIATTYKGKTIKVLVKAALAGYGTLGVYSSVTAKIA